MEQPPLPADDRSERPIPTTSGEKARHAAPEPERTGQPRRWFLAGGVAAVLAGAGGVGAALLRHEPVAKDAPPPRLLAAIEAERSLIADLDATTGGTRQVRLVLTRARADHAAHLAALRAVAAGYRGVAGTSSAAATAQSGTPRTATQLRAAERAASTRAAADAAALDGRLATLLASISACEATHAELLR